MRNSVRKFTAFSFISTLVALLSLIAAIFAVEQSQEIREKAAQLERADLVPPITKKVMVINFNPILESYGGLRLVDYKKWNNPSTLENTFISDVRQVSSGYLNYQIVTHLEIDDIPVKFDGFDYTDDSYLSCVINSSTCHYPDLVDYKKILADFQVCEKVNRGEVDELWLWGGPWFGYWEAVMTGPGAFWTNAPPITGTACQRKLNIMGFSYERGPAEMLEDLAHRVEGTMTKVYGGWAFNEANSWNKYTLIDLDLKDKARCGRAHFAPNSLRAYETTNTNYILSSCEDWLNYPNQKEVKESINCTRWGCSAYGFLKWWHIHLPKYFGTNEGKLNNWWHYVADYDEAKNWEYCAQFTNISDCDSKSNYSCAWYLCVSSGLGGCFPKGTLNSRVCTQATPTPTPCVKQGDANGDCKVDGFDYVVWWQNFGRNVSGPQNGDFNNSGYVDGFDYVIWWQNFGN